MISTVFEAGSGKSGNDSCHIDLNFGGERFVEFAVLCDEMKVAV
jgi:hypothetical protein